VIRLVSSEDWVSNFTKRRKLANLGNSREIWESWVVSSRAREKRAVFSINFRALALDIMAIQPAGNEKLDLRYPGLPEYKRTIKTCDRGKRRKWACRRPMRKVHVSVQLIICFQVTKTYIKLWDILPGLQIRSKANVALHTWLAFEPMNMWFMQWPQKQVQNFGFIPT